MQPLLAVSGSQWLLLAAAAAAAAAAIFQQ
jgi:hypothetical protein